MIDWTIVGQNFLYAGLGTALTLAFMMLGYWIFDVVNPLDINEELGKDNRAVGIVVAAIFVGLGIAVGLVIGMGLN
ncbi:MAG: DUF350 domain-containing protein [Pseudomonadota bacterium]